MNSILRRSLAPIPEDAWETLDGEAREVLKPYLSARRVVDINGPHGWHLGAANTGRIELDEGGTEDGVTWAPRKALPLVELRVPFILRQQEVDNILRGAMDPDLDEMEDAARKIAAFEEQAVYGGFAAAGVTGLLDGAAHKAIPLKKGAEKVAESVSKAIETLRLDGIGGPYGVVLSADRYHELAHSLGTGYPPIRVVRELASGGVYWSSAVDDGLVLSLRGGDFELVLGQDLAIGYASHDRDEIELYFTETFTFRILEKNAAVKLAA